MMMDHMVLLASDLEASLTWYETLLPLLGYEKARDHVFASPHAPAIDLRPAGEPDNAYRRHAPGLNHFGFTAPDRAAVERVKDAMAAAGFPVQDIQDLEGDQALFLSDPDGLRVEVTAYAGAA